MSLEFKNFPEPIIYNEKLYSMKTQGSSINEPGSKYSPEPVIYNCSLFKMGVTDVLQLLVLHNHAYCSNDECHPG